MLQKWNPLHTSQCHTGLQVRSHHSDGGSSGAELSVGGKRFNGTKRSNHLKLPQTIFTLQIKRTGAELGRKLFTVTGSEAEVFICWWDWKPEDRVLSYSWEQKLKMKNVMCQTVSVWWRASDSYLSKCPHLRLLVFLQPQEDMWLFSDSLCLQSQSAFVSLTCCVESVSAAVSIYLLYLAIHFFYLAWV